MGNKAVFFDRDGVLNVDVCYLYKKEDFVWIDGAIESIKYCNDADIKVIVVTNQSGVARGYYTEADVRELHLWMNKELQTHRAWIDAFYYCPHHPKGVIAEYVRNCSCRKPNPGLVENACEDYNVDKERSLLVGDKESDMECARRAGIRGIRFMNGNLLAFIKLAMQEDTI